MKKRAGRPRLDAAYRCRTRAWFTAVSQASGGITAGQLELLFGNVEDSLRYSLGSRPGLWGKYEKGTVSPRIKSIEKGTQSLVERVEEKFPGTAIWMTMPFWDLLSGRPMSMDDLRDIYWKLSFDVRDLIVTEPSDVYPQFWHTQASTEELCKQLLHIGSIDAISAILALVREGIIKQSLSDFECALESWDECLELISKDPVLKMQSRTIYALVHKQFVDDEAVVGDYDDDEDFW